jgi:hypothetical protein
VSELVAERYTTVPSFIDIAVWDGSAEAASPIIDWVLDLSAFGTARYHDAEGDAPARIFVTTARGTAYLEPGDGMAFNEVKGEFYPIPADVLAEKYRRANTII